MAAISDQIVCENGCTYADDAELQAAWDAMVTAASEAAGEPVPDIVGATPAHDIFQCPRCHALIPEHLR